jgi:hypothetical protein
MGRPPIGKEKLVAHNRALVKRWKEKNPERVRAQKQRARTRARIVRAQEARKNDPTGELAYEPLIGVDRAPDAKEPDLPLDCFDPDSGVAKRPESGAQNGALECLPAMEEPSLPQPRTDTPRETIRDGDARDGITEPPGFAEEVKRHNDFYYLKSLHDIRLMLEGKG